MKKSYNVYMSSLAVAYIQPKAAWNALSAAKKDGIPVYISGMSSYGKTELVKQFFAGKHFVYYSPCSQDSEKLSDFSRYVNVQRKTPLPVVFDDLQFCVDEEKRAQVLSIASRPDVFAIFIARPTVLDWLIPFCTKQRTIGIGEKELSISVDQVRDYMDNEGIDCSSEDVQRIHNIIQGNAYALNVAARLLHIDPDKETFESRLNDVFIRFMEYNVTNFWGEDLRMFFMKLSVVDSFTVDLAQEITQEPLVQRFISQAFNTGNFLVRDRDLYIVRPVPLSGWRHIAAQTFSKDELKEFSLRAARWYEAHDELEKAIKLYYENGDTEGVKSVLMQNSAQNPSNGHYGALSKYYFKLSESDIESDVVLMCGMSMVCSMCFKIDESERWYEKIKEKESSLSGSAKNEARRRVAYLDIALPHRGSVNVLGVIRSLGTLLTTKGIALPEFSVTSNLPSVMSGGKDFCEWSLKERDFAKKYGKIVSLALGRNGKCIVNLALAESLYEKGEKDSEVLSYMSHAQLEAELDNNLDMGFVAAGLLIRFYSTSGQMETAQLQLASFERKCKEQNVFKLYPNIRAIKCRLDLLRGDAVAVQGWLKKYAPNENEEMDAMLRYQYLTKVRCYISMGKLDEAFSIIEKLKWYAQQYYRTYVAIECSLLCAIILYNQGDERWREELDFALNEARHYSFVRVISDEGAAVMPLLTIVQEEKEAQEKKAREKAKKENPDKPYTVPPLSAEQEWFSHVCRLSDRMSRLYPTYCSKTVTRHTDFSDNAKAVLVLQMQGYSATKIAEKTGISFETVRYHIKQNYKKLGVKTKSEALIAARELGFL